MYRVEFSRVSIISQSYRTEREKRPWNRQCVQRKKKGLSSLGESRRGRQFFLSFIFRKYSISKFQFDRCACPGRKKSEGQRVNRLDVRNVTMINTYANYLSQRRYKIISTMCTLVTRKSKRRRSRHGARGGSGREGLPQKNVIDYRTSRVIFIRAKYYWFQQLLFLNIDNLNKLYFFRFKCFHHT